MSKQLKNALGEVVSGHSQKKSAKGTKEKGVTLPLGEAIDPADGFTGLEDIEQVCKGLGTFVDRVAGYMTLLYEKNKLKNRTLYFVTLTVPMPKRTATLLYGFANVLVKWIEKGGGTAWLMADWSQGKVGHWHGLILTSCEPKEMKRKWNELSGGGWSAQNIQKVWHQEDPTDDAFLTDIAKIVNYASKDVEVEVSRAERAVASGRFATLWEESMGRPPMDANYQPRLQRTTRKKNAKAPKKVKGEGVNLFFTEKKKKKEIGQFGSEAVLGKPPAVI